MLWNKYINAARIGVICQASSAPHFLLARLKGRSFQFVFQLVSLPYTLQLPSISDISVLQTAFKKSCSSKRGLLTLTTWDFFDISRLITPVTPNFSTEKVGINISDPCMRESKNKFGSKCDAFGADVSSRMYVYSPYTICLRNWLTQACATKGFAYAGLL